MGKVLDWPKIFRLFAWSEYTLEEVAQQEGITPEELRRQIRNQSTGGRNMEAARNALKRLEKLEQRALVEAGKNIVKTKVKQEVVKAGGKEVGKAAARWAIVRGGVRLLMVLGGIAAAVALLMTAYDLWQATSGTSSGAGGVAPTPCPELVLERRKCPWSPDGYAVEPCGPGFCYDAGPQGALSCKQEESVPNSYRNYTSDLVCEEGYVAERDPCTSVILRCVAP